MKLAAFAFALMSLGCVLNFCISGYISLQRAAELKLALSQMTPVASSTEDDSSIAVVVRIRPADLVDGQNVLELLAPASGRIVVGHVAIAADEAADFAAMTADLNDTALVRLAVERNEDTGVLTLAKGGIPPHKSQRTLLSELILPAATLSGFLSLLFAVLSIRSATKRQVPEFASRKALPRSARTLRTERRFEQLEA